MSGRRLAWGAIAMCGIVAGCGAAGPKQVYVGMTTAAEFGDVDGFLAGFTKESKPLVESQISLTEAYGLRDQNPATLLVFPTIDEVTEEGDKAILTVSKGSAKRKILMVKGEEGWRIDVKQLAEFWDAEKKKKN